MADLKGDKDESDMETDDKTRRIDLEEEGRRLLDVTESPTRSQQDTALGNGAENSQLSSGRSVNEDAFLSEMPGLLKEYFGKKTGFLPEGSMVMFGSLSHLARWGLENYAEECVKMKKVFTNMLPKSCIVTHVVLLPLGGLVGAAVIRDFYDLDSWLIGAGGGGSLPVARAELWRACLGGSGSTSGENSNDTRVHFMPESIHSSSKVRTLSGAPHVPLPAKFGPVMEEMERKIIFALMRELNDTFAQNVPEQPVMSRSSSSDNADPITGSGRIFAIGGSHIKRLVGGLAGLRMEIIDLSKPGWKADPDPLAELSAKTKNTDFAILIR
jgi:hypothetical protein